MKFLNLNSISNKLSLLIIVAIFPALAILLYSGFEQRQQSIENTKREISLLAHTIAEVQKENTRDTKQILAILSRLPAIQDIDIEASSEILHMILEQNTQYNNLALVDLNGDVLASGRVFKEANLADRKHVKEALAKKKFAVGEYVISRVGVEGPVFALACPVFNQEGLPKAVLTATINLDSFSNFLDFTDLPEKSFVALTDHKGIRLSYYPTQNQTNPVGKPINTKSWQLASKARGPGLFISSGSDGIDRIFAFEQVRINTEDTPYLYVWLGVPEAHILKPANAILARNLLFMALIIVIALFLTRIIGKKTIISPAQKLVTLTRRFAQNDLESRCELPETSGEIGELTKAFHDMADTLRESQRTLAENETRYRNIYETISDSLFIVDFKGNILEANPAACQTYGYSLHEFKNMHVLQLISPNYHHVFEDGLQTINNSGTFLGETTDIRKDGSTVSTEVKSSAIDYKGEKCLIALVRNVTKRKELEQEREKMILKLEHAIEEISALRGILPICSYCKNIRNDDGYYEKIESYIHKHSGVDFSHTICPTCMKKHHPVEFLNIITNKNDE